MVSFSCCFESKQTPFLLSHRQIMPKKLFICTKILIYAVFSGYMMFFEAKLLNTLAFVFCSLNTTTFSLLQHQLSTLDVDMSLLVKLRFKTREKRENESNQISIIIIHCWRKSGWQGESTAPPVAKNIIEKPERNQCFSWKICFPFSINPFFCCWTLYAILRFYTNFQQVGKYERSGGKCCYTNTIRNLLNEKELLGLSFNFVN